MKQNPYDVAIAKLEAERLLTMQQFALAIDALKKAKDAKPVRTRKARELKVSA